MPEIAEREAIASSEASAHLFISYAEWFVRVCQSASVQAVRQTALEEVGLFGDCYISGCPSCRGQRSKVAHCDLRDLQLRDADEMAVIGPSRNTDQGV